MQTTVNECVGCADGCHGCGLNNKPATICDECGEVCVDAVYHDGSGEDLCLSCAASRACEEFNSFSDEEKVELLNYKEV